MYRSALFCLALILITAFPFLSAAGMNSESDSTENSENIFWANSNINTASVFREEPGMLRLSVRHTFGMLDGGIDTFFGVDQGAHTRIGIEYGITERLSAGIGRMGFQNVVDIHSKYTLTKQSQFDAFPLETALRISTGIDTRSGIDRNFTERSTYLTSLMLAYSFGNFRLQASPMYAHYNYLDGSVNNSQLFGAGLSAKYLLTDEIAASVEYLPVIGTRNEDTSDNLGLGIHIDGGVIIYQVFLSATQWHNEQYIMANNNDRFWEGDIRIGFNLQRELF